MSSTISSDSPNAAYDKMMTDIGNHADFKTLDEDAQDFLKKTQDPNMKRVVNDFDTSLFDGSYNPTATENTLSNAAAGVTVPDPSLQNATPSMPMNMAMTAKTSTS